MAMRHIVSVMVLAGFVSGAPRDYRSEGWAIVRARGSDKDVEVGDLVVFNLQRPAESRVVGNTGLTDVGSMDFWGDELWAASFRDDKLSFYTVNVATAQATLRSTVEGTFSGVSAGGFDMQDAYYVVNMRGHNILRVDPWKGTILETLKMPSSAGYNGVALIGERFYAARGGTGDPPQEFGTIDLKTGEFTPIGYTNVGVNGKGGGNGCGALDYDQAARTLFLVYRQGIEQGQGWSLYTVDLTTGQATFVDELRPKAVYDAFAVRG